MAAEMWNGPLRGGPSTLKERGTPQILLTISQSPKLMYDERIYDAIEELERHWTKSWESVNQEPPGYAGYNSDKDDNQAERAKVADDSENFPRDSILPMRGQRVGSPQQFTLD
ncbi:hypothetical protein RND71_029096 [Anisodus tanguticus]|uniref:Uncharacterized protein n=1 Tax=Anisodus tanguticus TaxID=243964 RepID=A0AAE1RDX8_9SOLA|nr:hypothetical protein RND71_029096 [Anisodus tanguticus]